MTIADLIREELVLADLRATTKDDAIREIASHMASRQEGLAADEITRVLAERETLGSTAIGDGIAIPHAKLAGVSSVIGCFARSKKGVAFASVDGKPTRLFFVIVAPAGSTGEHLKALARISRLLRSPDVRKRLIRGGNAADLFRIIIDADRAAQEH